MSPIHTLSTIGLTMAVARGKGKRRRPRKSQKSLMGVPWQSGQQQAHLLYSKPSRSQPREPKMNPSHSQKLRSGGHPRYCRKRACRRGASKVVYPLHYRGQSFIVATSPSNSRVQMQTTLLTQKRQSNQGRGLVPKCNLRSDSTRP